MLLGREGWEAGRAKKREESEGERATIEGRNERREGAIRGRECLVGEGEDARAVVSSLTGQTTGTQGDFRASLRD
jgi:hypothetical protein